MPNTGRNYVNKTFGSKSKPKAKRSGPASKTKLPKINARKRNKKPNPSRTKGVY